MLLSIPTAEEARRGLDDMCSEMGKLKRQQLEYAVNTAIDDLQDHCMVEGELPKALLEALDKKGYRVEVGGRYNERDTYIYW